MKIKRLALVACACMALQVSEAGAAYKTFSPNQILEITKNTINDNTYLIQDDFFRIAAIQALANNTSLSLENRTQLLNLRKNGTPVFFNVLFKHPKLQQLRCMGVYDLPIEQAMTKTTLDEAQPTIDKIAQDMSIIMQNISMDDWENFLAQDDLWSYAREVSCDNFAGITCNNDSNPSIGFTYFFNPTIGTNSSPLHSLGLNLKVPAGQDFSVNVSFLMTPAQQAIYSAASGTYNIPNTTASNPVNLNGNLTQQSGRIAFGARYNFEEIVSSRLTPYIGAQIGLTTDRVTTTTDVTKYDSNSNIFEKDTQTISTTNNYTTVGLTGGVTYQINCYVSADVALSIQNAKNYSLAYNIREDTAQINSTTTVNPTVSMGINFKF